MSSSYQPVDIYDSVTESVFIIKPQITKPKPTPEKDIQDGFVSLLQGKETAESMALRRSLFKKTWRTLDRIIQETEQRVNEVGMVEICDFVNSSYQSLKTQEKGRLDLPLVEVPTAVAFAGVNTGDHGKLFSLLGKRIADNGHLVVFLESQYCTTLPNMLKFFIDQVVGNGAKVNSMEDTLSATAATKSIGYDIGVLDVFCEELRESGNLGNGARIAVVLQDFEGFSPVVIDDFVRIVHQHCYKLQIVLILGLATSYESIQQTLSRPSISMLDVERFNLQRSKECIDAITKEVLINCPIGLTFGSESYKSLLDQFLLYNFSITMFVRKIKYAVMDFFYANPLSIISGMISGSTLEGFKVSKPNKGAFVSEHVELLRMQRSVQGFLENHKDGKQFVVRALTDDQFMLETALPQMLTELSTHRQLYSLGIDFVQAIQEMGLKSVQKPLRTLHLYGLTQQFEECPHWKTISAVVRRMKVSELGDLLDSLLEIVSKSVSIDWSYVDDKHTVNIPKRLNMAKRCLETPEEYFEQTSPATGALSKQARTRHGMESRPFQLFDGKTSEQQLMALDKCSEMVEQILQCCLSSYRTVPLHEVFYFRHSMLLDTAFSAQPRAAVQAALGKSSYYINCKCCDDSAADSDDKEDGARILPTMQDICIAYKLHQECGRMINLYDWYSAFSSIVEKETRKHGPGQEEIQARFMRTVEEMKYLGFVRSTQRKTDHVVRLTWGA